MTGARSKAGSAVMAVALLVLLVRLWLEWRSGGLAGGADKIGAFFAHPAQMAILAAVLIGSALAGARALAFTLRLALGLIFIYASYSKLLDPQPFAGKVENYRILPRALINVFSICLIWVEFVTGVLLIIGLAARGAALVSAVLFVTFAVAMASAVARGLDIDCGCFTLAKAAKGADKVSWAHVVWRIVGLVASVQVLWASRPVDAPLRWLARGPSPGKSV